MILHIKNNRKTSYINISNIDTICIDEDDEDDYDIDSISFSIKHNKTSTDIYINLSDKNIDKIKTIKEFKKQFKKLIYFYDGTLSGDNFIDYDNNINKFRFNTIYLKENTINLKK